MKDETHALDHVINLLRRHAREMEEDLNNVKHKSSKNALETAIKNNKARIEHYLNG